MAMTLSELAAVITERTGLDARVKGDGNATVQRIATIDKSDANCITFLANAKYAKYLQTCQANAIILHPDAIAHWSGNALVMDNPYVGFAIVAQLLDTTPRMTKGVHPTAVVSELAQLGNNVSIGANAVIEQGAVIGDDVQIGAGCYVGQGTIVGACSRLWPNVTLYHGVELEERVVIHSHTVIGADGFGYAPQSIDGNQHWHRIPQLGGVRIGAGTEIGASTTIDRGAIDDTVIGKGVIIDNQIQIGHNVEIGDYSAIAASTAIAGSTKIGRNVTVGGAVAISGHLTIVDKAYITGRTLVIKDITEPGVYSSGMPAASNKEWRNNTARYRKLTELFDRVKALESKLP